MRERFEREELVHGALLASTPGMYELPDQVAMLALLFGVVHAATSLFKIICDDYDKAVFSGVFPE